MKTKMTNYRWVICAMLFFATTINYMDRQVLSLTWRDFIAPEFHWTNTHYGLIASLFTGFYSASMLFAGRLVDWLDTRKGYLWSIGIWSIGACLHALCGVATEYWIGVDSAAALEAVKDVKIVSTIVTVSVTFFVFARLILAIGEAGNFPAAIKATAEYFPKKDRAFATSLFNAGAQIGALIAPLTIPVLAINFGWELAFIIIGGLGFVWMGVWVSVYKHPEQNPRVNSAELAYINQDADKVQEVESAYDKVKLTFAQCMRQRQTWAFIVGKFMTDAVWWFFLFWIPAYLSEVYDIPTSDPRSQWAIFVLYVISMLSIIGGWLPKYFVDKRGMEPYAGRMRAMLIFAFFPLLVLAAQPLGVYSYWIPVVIIGIAAAAHQSWSANIFTTVSDMFPKSSVGTIVGIGGMAGGISSMLINYGSGVLFDYAEQSQMKFLGFEGVESGYMILFSICSGAYLIGWIIMKALVPKYKLVEIN